MKLQRIETPDYILWVSDKEIIEGDKNFWFINSSHNVLKLYYGENTVGKSIVIEKGTSSCWTDYSKKVIAYQPKGNAPELDLPLLPEIVFEDDVEKLIDDFIYEYQQEGMLPSIAKNRIYQLVKAATKGYSEEDLRGAMDKVYGWMIPASGNGLINDKRPSSLEELKNTYIQSLKKPKTPKWFVAEMEQYPINYHKDLWHNRLKTTTINGKTYLVGSYLYE
jgi:hypothetical protein